LPGSKNFFTPRVGLGRQLEFPERLPALRKIPSGIILFKKNSCQINNE